MDKKIIGLLGAAAALTAVNNANATEVQGTAPVPAANYRDLLNPVLNPLELLKADDARRAASSTEDVQLAQGYGHHHHHHHHHHVVPRVIRQFIPPRRHHHHHHHHHHSNYYGR
jgi:hypothetical protein